MSFLAFVFIVFACLGFVLHFALADGVYVDAKKLDEIPDGKGALFVAPRVWWLATILLGLAAVAVYWLIHHSTLRRDP